IEDPFHRPYFVVDEYQGVVMLAIEQNSVILIEQYRKPVTSNVIQLPGGGVKKGEDLEYAARREFFEETGYQCGRVHYLGYLQPASWRTNEITHVFFTSEIGINLNQQLEEHERIKVIKLDIKECLTRVKENQLHDSELCYALLQAILKGFIYP
ncbi:NUDIX hydrolase, partial [Neobacillus drentensis]|uniref:NUDIX hydrolase n=1 Tax=Neobacillus drentensis TaxID=220684 RepID=UPI0030012FF8